MVQNTACLILCLLAGPVLMVSVSYKECEPKEFGKCNKIFTDVFKNSHENQDLLDMYCKAYKEKVQCLESNVTCVGETIDVFRFAVLQQVSKDIILGTCTNIDLTPLKNVVHANEKYRMKFADLKDLEKDHFQPCAAKKNVYCASRFAEELKSSGKHCQALQNYFKCYESKDVVCDDKIFKDFVKIVKELEAVVKEFAKNFPNDMPGC